MLVRRLRPFLLLFLAWLTAAWPAAAAVTVTFYSHDFGSRFPHAFVVLEGAPDGGGAAVSGDYGFTAKRVTPAILMGSVEGDIESAGVAYVASSQPHWRMTLTDGQYAAVLAVMEKWRAIPGKSYNLTKRNCVHFVADIARAVGVDVVETKELMQKPRSFLQSVLARNRGLEVAAIDGGMGSVPVLRVAALASVDPVVPLGAPPTAAPMAESAARSMSRVAGMSEPEPARPN